MPTDNKKVDGIKKVSKADLEKSRNIVLETIGEFDKKEKISEKVIPAKKNKVDSIQAIKEAPDLAKDYEVEEKERAEPIEPKIDEKKRRDWRREIKSILPTKKIQEAEPSPKQKEEIESIPVVDKPASSPKPAVPEPKKEIVIDEPIIDDQAIAEKKAKANISRINPFKNEIVEKKIKQKEEMAKKEALEREKKREEEREAKREELLKFKLKKEKLAKQKLQARQAVRRIRRKKIKKFFIDLRLSVSNIRKNFFMSVKLALITIFAAVIVLTLFYSLLAVAILKFDFVNPVTSYISKYLPVPAFITRDGIVEYSFYSQIKTELKSAEGASVNETDIKVKIAEKIIYEALIRKYNLEFSGEFSEELKNEIAINLVRDAEINQVGIYRIQKIKSLINKGENFVSVSNKYGDDQDLLTITDANKAEYSFAEEVSALAVNQISDIVYSDNGYYIFRCYDKDSKQIALSYVFVNAKTLDRYLSEAVEGYKMWSLVE